MIIDAMPHAVERFSPCIQFHTRKSKTFRSPFLRIPLFIVLLGIASDEIQAVTINNVNVINLVPVSDKAKDRMGISLNDALPRAILYRWKIPTS